MFWKNNRFGRWEIGGFGWVVHCIKRRRVVLCVIQGSHMPGYVVSCLSMLYHTQACCDAQAFCIMPRHFISCPGISFHAGAHGLSTANPLRFVLCGISRVRSNFRTKVQWWQLEYDVTLVLLVESFTCLLKLPTTSSRLGHSPMST